MAQRQDKDVAGVFERDKQPPRHGSKEFNSWVNDHFFKKRIDPEVPASNSSVRRVIMRVKAKLQKDKKFKNRLAQIENNILKGQT